MIDLYKIAVTTVPPGMYDFTGSCCPDWGAGCSPEVCSIVWSPLLEDRVVSAWVESTRDSGEEQWGTQEGLPAGDAIQVVVPGVSVRGDMVDGQVLAAIVL